MCTLTFWPTSQGGILTQNRDEQPSRSSVTIVRGELTYPKDARAGGTWAATNEGGAVRCLLNGAFEKHRHEPPYRMSRGRMVLDSFAFDSIFKFVQSFDFQGVEPFTMIDFWAGSLTEIRWDGYEIHYTQLPIDAPMIWSSCTLYEPAEQVSRAAAWQIWQSETADIATEIWQLHTIQAAADAPLSLVRSFDVGAKTVSTVQFEVAENRTDVRYYERETGSIQQVVICHRQATTLQHYAS